MDETMMNANNEIVEDTLEQSSTDSKVGKAMLIAMGLGLAALAAMKIRKVIINRKAEKESLAEEEIPSEDESEDNVESDTEN